MFALVYVYAQMFCVQISVCGCLFKCLYEFYSVLTCLFVTKSVAEQFRKDLLNIAMTTLSSKILSQDKVHFANLAVDAVLRLKVIPLILCRNVISYCTNQFEINNVNYYREAVILKLYRS